MPTKILFPNIKDMVLIIKSQDTKNLGKFLKFPTVSAKTNMSKCDK